MSRSPFAHRRAANQADFAGPDADREAIERLARSARLANEQQQGGGRVADEVLQRNTLLIEAAQAELIEMLERKVHLFLFVKVRENWQEDPERYREMGLDFES